MTQQEMMRVKRAVIRKYPIFASVALLNVPIEEDNRISTAAVWAEKDDKDKLILKGIKYNSEFFDNLTFDEQVFVLAHETCHIAFKHFARSLDKPEKDIQRNYEEYCSKVSDENLRKVEMIKLQKKYYNYWNIATDACINAFLKKDGLQMPEGVIDKRTGHPMKFVNIEDGLYRRAELIYDSIVKKEENKEKNKDDLNKSNQSRNSKNNTNNYNNQGQSNDNQIGGGLDDIDVDNYQGIDSHEEWVSQPQESKEKEEQSEKEQKNKKSFFDKIKDFFNQDSKEDKNKKLDSNNSLSAQKISEISDDEASVFAENEKELNKSDNNSITNALSNITREVGCSNIKLAKPIFSWKQLLIRSVEEEVEIWGYRRANRYMPNARMEDRTLDNKSTTEIILDTSGSISDELLRGFLMQLIPLFKETKIKVGCFSGMFYGFTELKTMNEVKEFKAIRDKGGTNFEAAVTAFSQNHGNERVNKIVFTDGQLDDISSHVQRTMVDGIMWVVFGNKMDFKPLGGKIIKISEKDLNEMINMIRLQNNLLDCNEEDLYGEHNIKKGRR